MSEDQAEYGKLKVIDKRAEHDGNLPAPTDSNSLVMAAINRGLSPELIEKMMSLSERNDANQARKAYFEAVAEFKAEAPPVKKDKYNKFFSSHYTSLGNLLDTYNPVLGKHGLSISFPTPQQTEKSMTVECRLSHRMGHTESISITAPIDQAAVGKSSGERSRNPIQDIKSTFTYLRSATCEAILGVAGTEGTVNDDGNGAGGALYIDNKQLAAIKKLIAENKVDQGGFLKHMGIEKLEGLPAKLYGNAVFSLKAKKKVEREPGEEG